MPAQTNPRRAITVDDSGAVTRQPRPVRRITGVSLSARGNAISASEAVRAVQYPESDTSAYHAALHTDPEIIAAVRAAGGTRDFLFAGQRGRMDEEEETAATQTSWLPTLERSRHNLLLAIAATTHDDFLDLSWAGLTTEELVAREGRGIARSPQPALEWLGGRTPISAWNALLGDPTLRDFRDDSAEFDQIVRGVYQTMMNHPDISSDPGQRGIREFRVLSDTVAAQISSYEQYLAVMNRLLLGYASPGDYAVVATRAFGGSFSTDYIFQIGDEGLHPDFDDDADNQISFHIWSYIATTASPANSYITGELGEIGNFWHEFIEPIYNRNTGASIEDFRAGQQGLHLGQLLRSGSINYTQLGEAFELLFASDRYLEQRRGEDS